MEISSVSETNESTGEQLITMFAAMVLFFAVSYLYTISIIALHAYVNLIWYLYRFLLHKRCLRLSLKSELYMPLYV